MSASLIDVIIPNRNKGQFLERTIASLKNQTETHWRAIVIDGYSDDNSWEILQKAAREDSRFEIMQMRPPSKTGLSFFRAWNQGLMRVRAPYFAILTSDDLWEPDWLANALKNFEDIPNTVAVAARPIFIDKNHRQTGMSPTAEYCERSFNISDNETRRLDGLSIAIRALLIGPVFITIHAIVFRREVIEGGILFAEDIDFASDHELYLHLGLAGDVVYDTRSKALFRIYAEQESSAVTSDLVTRMFRKIVTRNRNFVAEQTGISKSTLVSLTDEMVARHRFIMKKPNWATYRKSKIRAAFQMLWACIRWPRLGMVYFGCRCNRERFLSGYAARVCRELHPVGVQERAGKP